MHQSQAIMLLQSIRPNIVQAIRAYRPDDLQAAAQEVGQHFLYTNLSEAKDKQDVFDIIARDFLFPDHFGGRSGLGRLAANKSVSVWGPTHHQREGGGGNQRACFQRLPGPGGPGSLPRSHVLPHVRCLGRVPQPGAQNRAKSEDATL